MVRISKVSAPHLHGADQVVAFDVESTVLGPNGQTSFLTHATVFRTKRLIGLLGTDVVLSFPRLRGQFQ